MTRDILRFKIFFNLNVYFSFFGILKKKIHKLYVSKRKRNIRCSIYSYSFTHINILIFSLTLSEKNLALFISKSAIYNCYQSMFRLFIKSRYKNFSRELTLNLLISPGNKTKQAVTFSRSRKKIISRSINIDTESND